MKYVTLELWLLRKSGESMMMMMMLVIMICKQVMRDHSSHRGDASPQSVVYLRR